MRVKSSYLFAGGLFLLVVLFFIVMNLVGAGNAKHAAQAKTAEASANAKSTLPSVQVALTPETQREYAVTIRGRTEAARSVSVRSETSGVVASTPVIQGTAVRKGAVLCRLNVDARQATLDQARANQRSVQLQHGASVELAKKGYRSQTQVLQDQANLDAANAAVRQAEIAVAQMNIRAPFDGVFDKREAEVGAYLSPGQPCGMMIELNPLLIVGDLPEADAGKLHVGSPATAKLLTGEALAGRVRYVARDADAQTRTYHIEITAPNPSSAVRSGLSATIRIAAGTGPAHLVPLSSLVLDAAGRQGVRHVLADDKVAFTPVTVQDETPAGLWVTGLHGPVRVVTVGQSYVNEGQKVRVAAAR
jgi:multidrug efflux system membrane fusion protein